MPYLKTTTLLENDLQKDLLWFAPILSANTTPSIFKERKDNYTNNIAFINDLKLQFYKISATTPINETFQEQKIRGMVKLAEFGGFGVIGSRLNLAFIFPS